MLSKFNYSDLAGTTLVVQKLDVARHFLLVRFCQSRHQRYCFFVVCRHQVPQQDAIALTDIFSLAQLS
jgi:hypothetical protein